MKINYAVKRDRKALIHRLMNLVMNQSRQAVIHHHARQIVIHINHRANNHNKTKERKRKQRKNTRGPN